MDRKPAGEFTFPIKLRCALATDLTTGPELEAALARALGRAFARARSAFPDACFTEGGVALQPPYLARGNLSGSDAAAVLSRVQHAIETAALAQSLLKLSIGSAEGADATPSSFRNVTEPFRPERFDRQTGTYKVPSYDDGGQTTGLPVVSGAQAQLDAQWESTLNTWEEQSKTLLSFEERAAARRVYILLEQISPSDFADADTLDKFIDKCIKDGCNRNEKATLAWFAENDMDAILLSEGAAFPDTWVWKIQTKYGTSADRKAAEKLPSARSDIQWLSEHLSDDVWEHGLPLSLDEASRVSLDNLERLALNSEEAKAPKKETIITNFTRALLRLARANAHVMLVHSYKRRLDHVIERIRKGDLIIDDEQYDIIEGRAELFYALLHGFEDAAEHGDNVSKQIAVLLVWNPNNFDRLHFRGWPPEGVQALWNAIGKADDRIQATEFIWCIWRAAVWANERDYYADARHEVFEAIREHPYQAIGKLVAFIIAGEVPGVNIVAGTVLVIEFGLEVIDIIVDLTTALTDAGTANSVVQMEHASAQLARTLVGKAVEVALWVINWGVGKGLKSLQKYIKVEKFLKANGDNAETREALRLAKGDAEQAEKILTRKREYESQQRALEQAERQRKAAEAERQRIVEEKQRQEAEAAARKQQEQEGEGAETQEEVEPGETEGAAAKTRRTVAQIARDLKSRGITQDDMRSFRGRAKRLSAPIAELVEQLLDHFSAAEVKELGQFFRKNSIALTEEFVKELIKAVPRGKIGEFVKHLEILQVHDEASMSSGLQAEEPTLTKTTTVYPGRPPKISEIVETPGSKILRANLIKRYGEQPPEGYAAHHIIPEREFAEGLDWMRRRFGKNINDADNGVFLAAVGSAAPKKAPTPNPDLTVLHQSYIHAGPSKEYAYTLTRRLSGLHGNEFIAELRNIAKEMSNGKFKIDEIPYGWKEKWQPGMTAPIEPGFEPGWIEEE